MISDELFNQCLVILQDSSILEEDQAEGISRLIASKTSLEGKALDNEVMAVLWRYRGKDSPTSSARNNYTAIVRRASPAPWQFPRVDTPTSSLGGTPPAPPPGFPSSFKGSPFPSPRNSPRPTYSAPFIPHSPTLNNYEPALAVDSSYSTEVYGDYGSDTVQWLVGDENVLGYDKGATLNMSPHDMLRSVLGEGRTDEEIDRALESCGYDLAATFAMLVEQQQGHDNYLGMPESVTVIGKSTSPNPEKARPVTPRSGVVCRFFMTTGQCLRSDCRFSHDLGTTICKYWLAGNCLAGDTCIFSHDPTMSVSKMTLGDDSHSRTSTPPPHFQFQDSSLFPALLPEQWPQATSAIAPPPGFKLTSSRPSSRQQVCERDQSGGVMCLDDTEAFPSLGSAKSKKRERRHKNEISSGPSCLADVVRMSPSPGPNSHRNSSSSSSSNRWSGGSPSSKRLSQAAAAAAAASHIPAPQQIPWLETGSALNRTYMKFRKEAHDHQILRNKYLQLASAAWQKKNDAKAAKEHSRKANNENLAMARAHKEAAKAIYEERNRGAASGAELFVDLHGLLPDEAVRFLEEALLAHQHSTRPVYAVCGTGHHSKGGKDKIGRAVRGFLDEWKYTYREFSVSGDRNSNGGILGIDPASFDKVLAGTEGETGTEDSSAVASNNGGRGRSGKK